MHLEGSPCGLRWGRASSPPFLIGHPIELIIVGQSCLPGIPFRGEGLESIELACCVLISIRRLHMVKRVRIPRGGFAHARILWQNPSHTVGSARSQLHTAKSDPRDWVERILNPQSALGIHIPCHLRDEGGISGDRRRDRHFVDGLEIRFHCDGLGGQGRHGSPQAVSGADAPAPIPVQHVVQDIRYGTLFRHTPKMKDMVELTKTPITQAIKEMAKMPRTRSRSGTTSASRGSPY